MVERDMKLPTAMEMTVIKKSSMVFFLQSVPTNAFLQTSFWILVYTGPVIKLQPASFMHRLMPQ